MENKQFMCGVLVATSISLAWIPCHVWGQDPADVVEKSVDPTVSAYKVKRPAKGTVSVVGPEDFGPLVKAWEKEVQKVQPDLKVEFSVGQPAEASQQLREGKRQLALMTRTMRVDEIAAFRSAHGARPACINVGLGTLVVTVHPSNPLASVSLEQLDAIYSATPRRGAPQTATTWGEIGLQGEWAARKIKPAIRGPASGGYSNVAEMVLIKAKFAEHVQYKEPGEKIVEFVASNPEAIGFAPLWVGLDKTKVRAVPVVSVDGRPTHATVESVLDGTYPSRPIVFYAKYAKGDPPLAAEVEEFLRFTQSREGQTVIVRFGAIPLTANMVEANTDLYDDLGLSK